ncbi:hypothetical protein [Blastopirellula marina]|uniref:Uncharacterized protein n=1 Tax=Blastopirellula marina TaxID=124 RepID=A0A2S8FMZ6_9BACT|nr:hypothetical protein [Blastopirellula marina]PQO33559.1 hypothetical protein C5Y98_15060 [Blastopirellula marina]PTL43346.1 hypothetical protein C5Y97_15070 [Blastopirellula marina]
MARKDYTRRDFHKLSAAALGGMISAGAIGCGGEKKPADDGGEAPPADTASDVAKHACRGLNECKGQGVGGKNDCAGTSTCATIAHHACGGQNECKGQGGCGETPGANECATKGHCAIPMEGGMWEKARKIFEEKMKEKGVELKPAPEKAA